MSLNFPKKLLVLVTIIAAIFIRFYNFPQRVNYGPEQAMSLITSGRNVSDKFSLLGQRYLRETASGHILFSGAVFNYSLIPLQLVFGFDPIPITGYFGFLNVTTGVLLFFAVKKFFDLKTAFLSSFLFLFNSLMVYHSLFIWNYNYLPLLSILILYFLWRGRKKGKSLSAGIVGFLVGVGISLQYLFILPFIVTFFLMLKFSREKVKTLFLFMAGTLLGNFPMVLFDLRHDFYHVRTLLIYLNENTPGFDFSYYHFLYLWPIFFIIGGIFLAKVSKKFPRASVLLTGIYVFINLNSGLVSFKGPVGMLQGLTADEILSAAEKIAEENPGNFNIVSTLDFDARGHVLRYPLEFISKFKPRSVEEYASLDAIYVLAKVDYNFENSSLWELSEFRPYKTSLFYEIDENYAIFKLQK